MEAFHDGEDPGWSVASSALLWALVPGLAATRLRKVQDQLIGLRQLFMTFVSALLLIGVVVVILSATHFQGSRAGTPIAVGLVLVGGVAATVVSRLMTAPLNCRDELTLAASYRTRFFLRIALADVAALLGFAGFILSGRPWLYPLGLVVAAVGYARLAPTARNLEADQDELRDHGCTLSLISALRRPPAK